MRVEWGVEEAALEVGSDQQTPDLFLLGPPTQDQYSELQNDKIEYEAISERTMLIQLYGWYILSQMRSFTQLSPPLGGLTNGVLQKSMCLRLFDILAKH